MRALVFSIAWLALLMPGLGCRHARVGPLPEYGQPAPGKIAIVIGGDVKQIGRYYVDEGTTLAGLAGLVGDFCTCPTCGMRPSHVIVFPQAHPEISRRYSLAQPEQLQTVRLNDGDAVRYATIHEQRRLNLR